MNNHVYSRLGTDDAGFSGSISSVLDARGTCREDEDLGTIEEAFPKVEAYLRTEEIPDRFGAKVVRQIEAAIKKKKPGKLS
jgi:hypothetical protein